MCWAARADFRKEGYGGWSQRAGVELRRGGFDDCAPGEKDADFFDDKCEVAADETLNCTRGHDETNENT